MQVPSNSLPKRTRNINCQATTRMPTGTMMNLKFLSMKIPYTLMNIHIILFPYYQSFPLHSLHTSKSPHYTPAFSTTILYQSFCNLITVQQTHLPRIQKRPGKCPWVARMLGLHKPGVEATFRYWVTVELHHRPLHLVRRHLHLAVQITFVTRDT